MGCTSSKSITTSVNSTKAPQTNRRPSKKLFFNRDSSIRDLPLSFIQGSIAEDKDTELWRISVEARELHGLKPRSGSEDCTVTSSSASSCNANQQQQKESNKKRDVFSIFEDAGLELEIDRTTIVEERDINCAFPLEVRNSMLHSPTSSTMETCLSSNSFTNHLPQVKADLGHIYPQLNVSFGSHSVIGLRSSNEDAYIQDCTQISEDDTVGFFGVYDGHGGSGVADYLAEHLHKNVYNELRSPNRMDLEKCVATACDKTDTDIFNTSLESGSTAIFMLMKHTDLVVTSIGDSQAVLSTNGVAKNMCVIHKPSLDSESERILGANGHVVGGRIFGVLGVSRAFGDNDFKTSKGRFKDKFNGDLVSSVPDIQRHTLTERDEFMVMGCDGLFDVMDPQQVVNFVRLKLYHSGTSIQQTTEDLIEYALQLGSCDNISVVIVNFNHEAGPEGF